MISIITCSKEPARLEAFKTMLAAAMGSHPWELIPIVDARSLAEGYTRGIAASGGDFLVFCHDDIVVLSPDFPQRLMGHLSRFDMVGVAGTNRVCSGRWLDAGIPYIFGQVAHPVPNGKISVDVYGAPAPAVGNIQALDGLLIAVRRAVLSRIGFDAVTFDGFHHYDMDFSFAAYQAEFRLGIANDINLFHLSVGKYKGTWPQYKERFERKWSSRLARKPGRRYMWAAVEVNTPADAMEIMNPEYWREKA